MPRLETNMIGAPTQHNEAGFLPILPKRSTVARNDTTSVVRT